MNAFEFGDASANGYIMRRYRWGLSFCHVAIIEQSYL